MGKTGLKKGVGGVIIVLGVMAATVCVWGGVALAGNVQVEELLKEIRALKTRVQQLEERLAHYEGTARGEEAKSLEGEEKPVSKVEGAISELFKRVSFAGGITMVGQGTQGLKEDVADGNISADLEITVDVGHGGRAFLALEAVGGDGLTDEIGGVFGVNADAGDNGFSLELAEVWYEQGFLNERFVATVGKIDMTNYVDTNLVANDETAQFISPGFVNSPVVEFPDPGLGVMVNFWPLEWLGITLGWQEADGDFEDILDDGFGVIELDINHKFGAREGNYRLYGWLNGTPHTSWARLLQGRRGDSVGWGVGFSADQEVLSWLQLFGRVGLQDEDLYEFHWSLSGGGALSGELWGREDDHLGLAYGVAYLSHKYRRFNRLTGQSEIRKDEHHFEAYYSIGLIKDHLYLSPHFQVLRYPEGNTDLGTVFIGGLRMQISF